ncbi:MAG: PAS domain-containing protein [Minwuia sp.]|uniref:PAS domain-containing protein n=1 Tax=Minwuia sp. TaxID=2493630 RepID=UPI003A8BD5F8
MNRSELESLLTGELCWLFHSYWWRLRDACGGVPPRRDFDPAEIKAALPFIVLHDMGEPGKSIMRLCGTGIAERFGLDPTGRDYMEFVSEERRPSAYRELITTASHPCGMRIIIEARYRSGRRTLAESIGYPLTGSKGQPMMLFVDQLIERLAPDLNQRAQPLAIFEVRERDYVDIGLGVPGKAG